jgi:hypothetical protein
MYDWSHTRLNDLEIDITTLPASATTTIGGHLISLVEISDMQLEGLHITKTTWHNMGVDHDVDDDTSPVYDVVTIYPAQTGVQKARLNVKHGNHGGHIIVRLQNTAGEVKFILLTHIAQ